MNAIWAAITGAAAGGVVNYILYKIRRKNERKQKAQENKQEWCGKIERLSRELRTISIRLESGNKLTISSDGIDFSNGSENLQQMGELINELEDLSRDTPENLDSSTQDYIDEFIGRLRNPRSGQTTLQTTTDLSEFIYSRCHELSSHVDDQI